MSECQPHLSHGAIELVAAVVDVSQGEKVLRVYHDNGALMDFVCMAHGTARTEMLDLLGLGETAKVIVMCLIDRHGAQEMRAEKGQSRTGGHAPLRIRTGWRCCGSGFP